MSWKGFFKPKNPAKYAGNSNNIVYRSQIELRFMMLMDTDPNVVTWASEEFHIDYFDKSTNKPRRYFPDFIFKNRKGETFVVEIKCTAETRKPILLEGKKKKFEKEMTTWITNQCKWEACEAWCKERGYKFKIITEQDLGIRY